MNSFDPNLVVKTLANEGMTYLQNKLTSLNAFTKDFSSDVVAEQGTVYVPISVSAGSVLVNPSSFEAGDTTVTGATVTLEHYSKPFHLTSKELNEGKRLEQLAKVNMSALCDQILIKTFSTITTGAGNFGTATYKAATATAFEPTGLQSAWAEIPGGATACVLTDQYFYRLLPTTLDSFDPQKTPGVYGFESVDHVGSGLFISGGASNMYGFVARPEALAIAAGVPDMHPAVRDTLMAQEISEVPELGLSVQTNLWANSATRAVWASYDLAFGVAKGDPNAAKLLVKA